ncbi:hypothetical protein C8Q70DRAFT_911634 [Cubamyces menziesii]|nr:hypothetical protein C8Q70DRAFT_911634 [Cubamyces menziesii]
MPLLYQPFSCPINSLHAQAVRDVLTTCMPCNIMCMRSGNLGHVRYNHVHNIGHRTIGITLGGARRDARQASCYLASVAEVGSLRSDGVMVPVGHYPIPRRSRGSRFTRN